MGAHLKDGKFQSDKYPTCPPGKVPLSVKDPTAQDLLWVYAQRRRTVDAEFSDDLETALRAAGYSPAAQHGVSVLPVTVHDHYYRADCICGWWCADFKTPTEAWEIGNAHILDCVKKEKSR